MKDFTTKEMELFDKEFPRELEERDTGRFMDVKVKDFLAAHDQRFIDEIIGMVEERMMDEDSRENESPEGAIYRSARKGWNACASDIITTLQGYKK